jgi:hypothetical protein
MDSRVCDYESDVYKLVAKKLNIRAVRNIQESYDMREREMMSNQRKQSMQAVSEMVLAMSNGMSLYKFIESEDRLDKKYIAYEVAMQSALLYGYGFTYKYGEAETLGLVLSHSLLYTAVQVMPAYYQNTLTCDFLYKPLKWLSNENFVVPSHCDNFWLRYEGVNDDAYTESVAYDNIMSSVVMLTYITVPVMVSITIAEIAPVEFISSISSIGSYIGMFNKAVGVAAFVYATFSTFESLYYDDSQEDQQQNMSGESSVSAITNDGL